jgi:hypothetical protein
LPRAGSGFTGRANSVLPLGSPGYGLADAMAHVDDGTFIGALRR